RWRSCIPSSSSLLRRYTCLASRVSRTIEPGAHALSALIARDFTPFRICYHLSNNYKFDVDHPYDMDDPCYGVSSPTEGSHIIMSTTADQLDTRNSASISAAEASRRSERRRWIALAVLCLGQLMMVLDAT